MSVFPFSVREYSTVGGIVLYCFRLISPSFSGSRRSFVSMVAVTKTHMPLFTEWGITLEEKYSMPERAIREIKCIDVPELMKKLGKKAPVKANEAKKRTKPQGICLSGRRRSKKESKLLISLYVAATYE